MANEDLIERAEHTVRVLERMGPKMIAPHHAERVRELIAALREAREDLRRAQEIIVIGMESMQWGAAVGAMLEDADVKKAYAAMKTPGGEGE